MISGCRIPFRLSRCEAYKKFFDQNPRLWLSLSTTCIYADICARYLLSLVQVQASVNHSLIIPFSINCLNSNIHLFVVQKYKQELKYKIITMWCSYFFLNPCFYFFQWCSVWQILQLQREDRQVDRHHATAALHISTGDVSPAMEGLVIAEGITVMSYSFHVSLWRCQLYWIHKKALLSLNARESLFFLCTFRKRFCCSALNSTWNSG